VRRQILAAVAIASVVSMAACGSPQEAATGGGGSNASDTSPIKVGLVYSKSGALASYGAQYLAGFQAGIDHLTGGTGKLAERPIEVTEVDDAGDPAKAVSAAKDLIGKGVKIIAGSTASGVALQVAPLAEQNKVLFVSGPAATDALTGAGKYTFRSGRQTWQDILTAAGFIGDVKGKKVLVLAQDSAFGQANVAAVKTRIANAYANVRTAMRNAGYADSSWTMLVQNYPSPIPNGSGFRYSQSGYTRQDTGGCGFWNADADWANGTALPTINNTVTGAISQAGITNAKTLNLASTFNGRRLCEGGVGLYEEVGLANWTAPTAVDRTEWVNQIRTVTTAGDSPYYIQESLHPNYWGQLATRSCVRQAYNGGTPRSGACVRTGTGLTSAGEPRMTLQ